jgi:hypothetical protein
MRDFMINVKQHFFLTLEEDQQDVTYVLSDADKPKKARRQNLHPSCATVA